MKSDGFFQGGAAESCAIIEQDQLVAAKCGHNSGIDVEKEFSTLPAPFWAKGKGWTYFLRLPGGTIKIGCSTRPMTRRLLEHRRERGAVEFLVAVPDAVIGEFAAHMRFDHLRIEGEIFRPEPELLAFIEELKGKDMTPFELHHLRAQIDRKRKQWKGVPAITHRLVMLSQQIASYDGYERGGLEADKDAMASLRQLMERNMLEIAQIEAKRTADPQ